MAKVAQQEPQATDLPSLQHGLRHKVESTPFRGKTVVSLCDLPAGEAVIAERLAIIVGCHRGHRPPGPLFPGEPGVGLIEAGLRAASDEAQEEFWKLSNAFPTKADMKRWIDAGLLEGREEDETARKMVGIFKTNSWSPGRGTDYAISLQRARINHSCQPNCRIDFDSVSRVLYIRAVVPIAEGDEIFIPYVDMRQLTRERRTMLGHVFNFRCTCPTCSLPVAKLAESDANRKRLREFEEVHARWKAGKTSGRMVMIEGIELLRKGGIFDQEGLFGNPSRMNYWCLLFDVAAAHSSRDEAIGCVRGVLREAQFERGSSERYRGQWESYVKDPSLAKEKWATRIDPMDPSMSWTGGAPSAGPSAQLPPVDMSWIEEPPVKKAGKKKKKNKKKAKSRSTVEIDDEAASEEEATVEAPAPAASEATPAPAVKPPESTSAAPSSSTTTPSPDPAFTAADSPSLSLSPTPAIDTSAVEPAVAVSPSPAISLPLPPSPPPTSPPSKPVFDTVLATVAAPPVSVDISTDELSKLAAERSAEEERLRARKGTETTVEKDGEWEKWPEEETDKWKQVGEERRKAEERRRVAEKKLEEQMKAGEEKRGSTAPPIVAQETVNSIDKENEPHPQGWAEEQSWGPSDPTPPLTQQPTPAPPPSDWRAPLGQVTKPRSKAVLRKQARKAKSAPSPTDSQRYTPGLPRRPPPSRYAERVTPFEYAKNQLPEPAAGAAQQGATLSATPKPRQVVPPSIPPPPPPPPASISQAPLGFVSRPPSPSKPLATPFTDPSTIEGSGWIRKSPALPTPPILARPSPTPPPDAPLVLATSAFLRKPPVVSPRSPKPSSPKPSSPVAERGVSSPTTSTPLGAVVEEQEEHGEPTDDPIVSLGLGGARSPAQPSQSIGAEDDQFDDADEEDEGEEQEQRVETAEAKVAGTGKGSAEIEKPAESNEEVGDDAFEDAEEDSELGEGEIEESPRLTLKHSDANPVNVKPALSRSSSYGTQPKPVDAHQKSVRFKQDLLTTTEVAAEPGSSPPFDVPPTPAVDDQHTQSPFSFPQTHLDAIRLPRPSLLPIPSSQTARPDDSSWRSWPNTVLTAQLAARPLETTVSAAAYLSNPPTRPIPPATERVEEWLASTQDHEQRDSQRRKLVAILKHGDPSSEENLESPGDFLDVIQRVEELLPPPRASPPHLSDPAIVRVETADRHLPTPTTAAAHLVAARTKVTVGLVGDERLANEAPQLGFHQSIPPPQSAPAAAGPSSGRKISSAGMLQLPLEVMELIKIEKTLELLPNSARAVVKSNLERVKTYPSSLPLSSSWTLYFIDSSHIKRHSKTYDVIQTRLFTATTVHTLCGSLKALAGKPFSAGHAKTGIVEHLKPGTSLAFFREDAQPTWESDWNRLGGRLLLVPPSPDRFDPIFERLILLLAGDSLPQLIRPLASVDKRGAREEEEGMLVGVVANRRREGEDRIELWVSGARKGEKVSRVWVDRLKQALPSELGLLELRDTLKYKAHSL